MNLGDLPLDQLSPSQLWSELDSETRTLAAEALYTQADRSGRVEADSAIAEAMRFRLTAVRRLSIQQRSDYLLRRVRPDDNLASSLLMALHLEQRKELLGAFLDALEIPHDAGVINGDHKIDPPSSERLRGPVEVLFQRFPKAQVETYLAALLALDPDSWGGLAELLQPS